MEYTEKEMLAHDIDCFISINNINIHFASAGAILPDVIRYAKENNEESYRLIMNTPDVFTNNELEINHQLRMFLNIDNNVEEYRFVLDALNIKYGDDIIDTYINKLYIPSFQKFARKGFISFDRQINIEKQNSFFWVARPHNLKDEQIKLKISGIYNIKFPLPDDNFQGLLLLPE